MENEEKVLTYNPDDQKWMAKAKCYGFDVNEFFPKTGVNIHHIKEFCSGCPVAGNCLDYALRYHIDHGVWGGTSPTEREDIRERRREHPYAAVRR